MERRSGGRHGQSWLMCRQAWIVAAVLLGGLCQAAPGQEMLDRQPVRAGTDSAIQLFAPIPDESFDFMVYGDRTGGPPEGVEVLREGVRMANRLDADFVLTVGDLVQGYNDADGWLAQMREFKEIMNGLRMPWYPVAGNHDVYARPKDKWGDEEHIDLYKRNFGPLYYSFDYKWAHFMVLFSDENLSFSNPAKNQNFSEEQLAWIKSDLASTSARQIFVFLHHPRWIKYYDGCNWPVVHELFVRDGRDFVCFGGHIHTYRDDGQMDNVHYYALATTGGWRPPLRETACIHHVSFVRVRPESYTSAVIPTGWVYGGDFVKGEEVEEMEELHDGHWLTLDGRAKIGIEKGAESNFVVAFKNPTNRDLRIEAEIEAPRGWHLSQTQIRREIQRNEQQTLQVSAVAPALGDTPPDITLTARLFYMLESGIEQPLETKVTIPVDLVDAGDVGAATPDENGVLFLDGESAVRVEMLEQLEQFTLECWVRGLPPTGTAGLVSNAEGFSGFSLMWAYGPWADGKWPFGYVGTRSGSLMLPSAGAWDWNVWTHLALVFDGHEGRYYVNGQPQCWIEKDEEHCSKESQGMLRHNRLPLMVGADPKGGGEAERFFTGEIDEVRLSTDVRYDSAFEPQKTFTRDDSTLLLLHFDKQVGAAFPDDSGRGNHGWSVGKPRIAPVDRD